MPTPLTEAAVLADPEDTTLDAGNATALGDTTGRRIGWWNRWCRGQVLSRLTGMALRLRDRTGHLLHDGGSGPTVTVLDDRLWASVALDGSDGSGDAYAAGWWQSDDLIAVARLFARERIRLREIDGGLGRALMPLHAFRNLFCRNTRSGARDNIHRHYDLGNAFFSRWLDPTLTYSSARWPHRDATLEEAQRHKLVQLFDRLALQPGEHLVEIGSGWGALAIEAARTRGVRVTTVTISSEQHRLAIERIAAVGLSDKIEVKLCDYRDLTGTYDKLVSVEMIEAVGSAFYGTFFQTCSRLLKPGGLAVLQAITIPDREFARAARESDFIKRRIFPGCCIPSLGALLAAASTHSDLDLVHHEDFAPHYARTLALWLNDVRAIGPELAGMGYDEEFQRLWHFYLAYCSGGFAERALGVAHLTFAKPAWRHADQTWLAP